MVAGAIKNIISKAAQLKDQIFIMRTKTDQVSKSPAHLARKLSNISLHFMISFQLSDYVLRLLKAERNDRAKSIHEYVNLMSRLSLI
jgi:hypothetical protein